MKRLLPLLALLAFPLHGALAETTVGHEITAVPYTITKAGTYYFTKDLAVASSASNGIRVEAPDVIIELNGHRLLATSSTSTGIGVLAEEFNKLTVEDGIVQGFQFGVVVQGDSCKVSGLTVTSCHETGIRLNGNYADISHNNISNTGLAGSTAALAAGIRLTGSDGVISDNNVDNTFTQDLTGRYADGIEILNAYNIVASNNRILDVAPASPTKAASAGISIASSESLILLSNIVSTAQVGFDLSGGISGKYGDNTTLGVTTSYNTSGSGMTDIGGNN